MGAKDKLEKLIEDIRHATREVLKHNRLQAQLGEEYREKELRIKAQGEVELKLFVLAVKLQASIERIFKHVTEKDEPNERGSRDGAILESPNHISKDDLEDSKQCE